jgi:signal transduction histidine kinase
MGRAFLLVLAIGLVPLAVGAVAIQRQKVHDSRRTLDRALTADARAGSADLSSYFDRARAIALLTSENPVFRDFYERKGRSRSGDPSFTRVNQALAYLQRLYPGALGEACFIDASGAENARVVRGLAARPSTLSQNESIHPFFSATFRVGVGNVYQAAPYLSPDMHVWVISNSTVVPMSGSARAIVHFEVSVESLRRALARERGNHLLVVDRSSGAIVADSRRPQLGMRPLGHTDPRYFPIARLTSKSGVITNDGLRMGYLRVPRGAANANDWVIVASSPALRGSVLGINAATLALLGVLLVMVALPIAYRWGRLNKDLTEREHDLDQSERRYRVLFEEAEAGRRLLAEQNDRLRQLDRMKDDFVASVSHELRTPLTSINGYVELLLEGEAGQISEEQASFLGVIRRNGERLLRVVGDLLFAAELDARTVELKRARVDLGALVVHAREVARPLADERQIELDLRVEPVSPIEGDPGRLGQAIDNLLSNALKFTPPGGRVALRVFETAAAAHVEVSDTGMGISTEDQAQLFERFFRTSEATSNAIQGTGLGLAIVAAIVEAHGGSIAVESEIGFGTTFRIVLPLTLSAEHAAA